MSQTISDTWTMPINLSQSGTASDPHVIVDSNGRFHVIWQEGSEGFAYTTGQGAEWQPAVVIELPFGTRRYYPDLRDDQATPLFAPRLIASADGKIHALWIDEQGNLFYSQVQAGNLTDFAAWSPRQQLAEGVVKADLSSGLDGRLHLSYIRSLNTPELPPGLYYRQSSDDGVTWSEPLALYQSLYFNLLAPETAHVQIRPVGATAVWIAWDDPGRERVFTIRSRDSGQTWEAVNEVDGRQATDDVDSVGPSHIQLAADGEAIHLAWQAGHEGLNCAQYHQWSADSGESWQLPNPFLETVASCPQSIQFLRSDKELFLVATGETESFMLVWNGSEWSEPQIQPELRGFLSEETFRWINYSCGQDVVTRASQVFVVSCGGAPGQDIWLASRSLDQLPTVAVITPVWSTPLAIHQGESVDLAPVLIADDASRFHALWSQAAAATIGSLTPPGKEIYYAAWDRERWTQPIIVPTPPEGDAEGIAAAVDSSGHLLTVWGDRKTGVIYFSRADVARAIMATEWSEPQPLPVPRPAASAPDIAVDAAGVIYIAYAIPVNEGRGIYVVFSTDGGANWSEPMLVFDAVTAGWEIVDQPQLAPADNGDIHMLWLRGTLPIANNRATLYYAQSKDEGFSWSEPTEVEEGSQGSLSVVWSRIATIDDIIVHRAWQEWNGRQLALWHQQSLDGGHTWSQASHPSGADGATGPAALASDRAGQMHLLQVLADQENNGTAVLQIWTWDDGRWLSGEGLKLANNIVDSSSVLAAAIGPDGHLGALYSNEATPEQPPQIIFSSRFLPLPSVTPTPPPTLTPPPTPTVKPSPTPLPQPTPTRTFPVAKVSRSLPPVLGPVGDSGSLAAGLAFAIIPVGFVVLLVWYRTREGEALARAITQKLDRWYVSKGSWLNRPLENGYGTQSPMLPDWFALLNLAGAALAGVLWYRFTQLGPWPLLVAIAPWFLRQSARPVRATPLDPLLGMFILTAGVGVWTTYDWTGGWAKFWLIIAAVLVFYALANQSPANLWLLAALLSGGSVLIVLYFVLTHDWNVIPAGIEIVDNLAQRWMAIRPPLGRSAIHPNQVAGIVAMLTPFLGAMGLRAWYARQRRYLALVTACCCLLLIGLFLTGSRGALLALSMALGTCLLWYLSGHLALAFNLSRRLVFATTFAIICSLIMSALLLYSGGSTSLAGRLLEVPSVSSRLVLYEHTLTLIRDFRFTGGGLAAFPGLYGHYILGIPTDFFFYGHNLFLGLLLEQGPLGLLAWGGLLIGSGWLLLRSRTADATIPSLFLLRWAMLASLLIIVIHGLVDDPLYSYPGTVLLFLIPGMVVALTQAVSDPFQWRWPRRRQVIVATGIGLLTMIPLLLAIVWGPLRANFYANLGAVTMARIELANWPSNEWDTGRNVALLEPAERLFNQALAAEPGQVTAHYRLGLIAMLRRDYAAAVEHLEVAGQANPEHIGIRKALGYSYAWAGRLEEATLLLASVPEASQELEIYAWWWVEQDRVDLAEQAKQLLARLKSVPATGN